MIDKRNRYRPDVHFVKGGVKEHPITVENAFTKAGFTEEEAMEVMKNHNDLVSRLNVCPIMHRSAEKARGYGNN